MFGGYHKSTKTCNGGVTYDRLCFRRASAGKQVLACPTTRNSTQSKSLRIKIKALDESRRPDGTSLNRKPRVSQKVPELLVRPMIIPQRSKTRTIDLHAALKPDTFVLEPDEVSQLLREYQLSMDELLFGLISPTQKMARPPISGFNVGAVGLGESGKVILGVNIELFGLPLNQSVHAEQCVIANAARLGERSLTKLAVSAAPCGHCRQFLCELPGCEALEIMVKGQPRASLADLLPYHFGPKDLLEEGVGPRLLQPHSNGLTLDSTEEIIPGTEMLVAAALAAADAAYTPYSESPAGLALATDSGTIHFGGAIESCAYNPTMTPLQTSLVAAVADGVSHWTHFKEAVLVETPNAKTPFAKSLELVLSEIAPDCTLHVYHAR